MRVCEMRRLSDDDVEQLAGHLAELGKAQLSLPDGLEAAAEDARSQNLASTLRAISLSMKQGKPLVDAIAEQDKRLPVYLRGYVTAAAQTSDFGGALWQLLEYRRNRRELRRAIWSAVAYPIVLMAIALSLCLMLALFVVPANKALIKEFDLDVSWESAWLYWFCDVGLWVLFALLAVAAIFVFIAPSIIGQARWARWRSRVPVFGCLSHWSGVAEFSRLLAVLLDHRVPLPEALTSVAGGTSNADVAEASRRMADAARQGHRLVETIKSTGRFPPSMAPFVNWGEQSGCLPDGLRAIAEMFDERVRIRSLMLQSILPPLFFLFVAVFGGFMIAGLLVPMVELISSLSG